MCNRRTIRKRLKRQKKKGGSLSVNLVKLAKIAISTVLGKGLVSSSASAGSGCCGKLTRQVSLDNQATSRQNTSSQLTVTALASAQGLSNKNPATPLNFSEKRSI